MPLEYRIRAGAFQPSKLHPLDISLNSLTIRPWSLSLATSDNVVQFGIYPTDSPTNLRVPVQQGQVRHHGSSAMECLYGRAA